MQITTTTGRTTRRLGTLLMVRRSHADPQPIRPSSVSDPTTVDGPNLVGGTEATEPSAREMVTQQHEGSEAAPATEGEDATEPADGAGNGGPAAHAVEADGPNAVAAASPSSLDAKSSPSLRAATAGAGATTRNEGHDTQRPGTSRVAAAGPLIHVPMFWRPPRADDAMSTHRSGTVQESLDLAVGVADACSPETSPSLSRVDAAPCASGPHGAPPPIGSREAVPPIGAGEELLPAGAEEALMRTGPDEEMPAVTSGPKAVNARKAPLRCASRRCVLPGRSGDECTTAPGAPVSRPEAGTSGSRPLVRSSHAATSLESRAAHCLWARRLRVLRLSLRRRLPRTVVTAWADRRVVAAAATVAAWSLSSAMRIVAGRRAASGGPSADERVRGLDFVRRILAAHAHATACRGPRAFSVRSGDRRRHSARSMLRMTRAALGRIGTELRIRLVRAVRADDGMSTAEYAIGTIAAAAFGAVLYGVVTGDSIVDALTGIIDKALSTSV